MDRRKPASPGKPAIPPPDPDELWQALMTEFEDACQEVLARLHAHEVDGTQEALHGLIRAQLRRSNALTDMLQFLDTFDDTGGRR